MYLFHPLIEPPALGRGVGVPSTTRRCVMQETSRITKGLDGVDLLGAWL
jgi:hypothetical protein